VTALLHGVLWNGILAPLFGWVLAMDGRTWDVGPMESGLTRDEVKDWLQNEAPDAMATGVAGIVLHMPSQSQAWMAEFKTLGPSRAVERILGDMDQHLKAPSLRFNIDVRQVADRRYIRIFPSSESFAEPPATDLSPAEQALRRRAIFHFESL